MANPTLPKCVRCVARQAELDAVAEIVGPSMLAERDGYMYVHEAVHRILDDLRAKVVDLERERDDARKAHAVAVARWTESRQEALRMRLLCNALSDDCESTCGLPLECPEHGPVIGGGRSK